MYNEILAIMDHNTIMEMIEDQNGIIAKMNAEIADKDAEIAHLMALLAEHNIEV